MIKIIIKTPNKKILKRILDKHQKKNKEISNKRASHLKNQKSPNPTKLNKIVDACPQLGDKIKVIKREKKNNSHSRLKKKKNNRQRKKLTRRILLKS